MTQQTTGIFIFHRDLRVIDNLALNELSKVSDNIIPIFVFTQIQTNPKENKYYNSNSIQFMVEAVEDLKKYTKNKLNIYYGDLHKIIEKIFKHNDIHYIGFNQDYTQFAKERTIKILKLCDKYQVTPIIEEDYTLINMNDIRNGNYYSVFKAYETRVTKLLKNADIKPTTNHISFSSTKLKNLGKQYTNYHSLYEYNDNLNVFGERNQALSILKDIKKFKKYNKERNIPHISTTFLSAHIKFGTVSVREVYQVFFKLKNDLVRQLLWKDFYAQLLYYMDYKYTMGTSNFKDKKIKWSNNISHFNSWKNGLTGFPIVDAAMRQLKQEGWMHNRCRLIVSNFLALVLNIDWRKGEKIFAQYLVDYDPSSNNGNWQFSAGVGIDRTPYLRVYNPFNQAKEYDKECLYIKKYLPELDELPNKIILNWDKYSKIVLDKTNINYVNPIVDFSEIYKKLRKT